MQVVDAGGIPDQAEALAGGAVVGPRADRARTDGVAAAPYANAGAVLVLADVVLSEDGQDARRQRDRAPGPRSLRFPAEDARVTVGAVLTPIAGNPFPVEVAGHG